MFNAIAELIEAKAELIREEAATTGLRTYSRAYKEGRDDLLNCECGCREDADIDAGDSPDCG